ncbi:MAG: FAD-dependent oxidoreductase [Candidatus Saccharimonadales bacterium]
MHVTFDHIDEIADNIKMFWFRPERPVRYIAGQFIELRIPHDDKDKRGDKRWFTLSSSPSEDLVAITTKIALKDGSTFKQALLGLKSDSRVTMTDAMGDFVLPKDESIPLVFVAGGIGVTPVRSMIKFLHDSAEKRNITLIYAARSEDELAFTDLFNKSNLKFIPVIGQPSTGWKGEAGRVNADRILELAGDYEDKYIYLSGPEPMTESLYKELKGLGVNKKHLVTDYFPGYTDI